VTVLLRSFGANWCHILGAILFLFGLTLFSLALSGRNSPGLWRELLHLGAMTAGLVLLIIGGLELRRKADRSQASR
jgi:hypothetical protein